MHLPQDIEDLIMDYHSYMCMFEVERCFYQHLLSIKVLEELTFAHKYSSTYDLEFPNKPNKVIANIAQLRGVDCQNRDSKYWQMLERVIHPKIKAIIHHVYGKEDVYIEVKICKLLGKQANNAHAETS